MHTARQWMVTHEWMLKSNRQTEWIDNKGILLWFAFYCGGLGGGLFIVSLIFNNYLGMLIGWAIVSLLKGTFHLVDLGKPTRFWRLVFNFRSSWLSRGLIFVILFSVDGVIQLVVSHFLSGTATEMALKVISGFLALAVTGYTGFVLNKVKGVSLWNVPFLPILFVNCGILGGFGMMTALSTLGGNVSPLLLEGVGRWLLIVTSLVLVIYLAIAAQRDAADNRPEVYRMKRGISRLLLVWVILLGIIIPLSIALESYLADTLNFAILISAISGELLSGMIVVYYILKSGIYRPLILAPGASANSPSYQPAKVRGTQWVTEK
jgi:formate-dependent nitrite reductase membrane component NrfD